MAESREAKEEMKKEMKEERRRTEEERRRTEEERRKIEEERRRIEEERRKTEEEERRKAEEEMKEERRKTEESWRRLQEAERRTQESLRTLRDDMNDATGEFDNKWGRFLERLVEGDLTGLLAGRGIPVDSVEPRVVGRAPRTLAPVAEYDLVATNGDGAVVVEVKTTLRVKDVRKFLGRLGKFRSCFPEYAGKSVHGAVACMETRKKDLDKDGSPMDAAELAEKEGLLVVRAPGGDSGASVVVNPEGFKPREF